MQKILWFMGPEDKKNTGIGLYSNLVIEGLESKGCYIEKKHIHYKSRSVKRYAYQYLWLPIFLLVNSRRYSSIILYEEAYAYLLLFCLLTKVKKYLIFHHLAESGHGQTLIEKIKDSILNINFYCSFFADKIIFPSHFSKDQYAYKKGKPIDNYEVIGNPIDIKKHGLLSKKQLFGKFGIGKDKYNWPIVLYVGSEESRKNVLVAIRGLKQAAYGDVLFVKIGKAVVDQNRKTIEHELKGSKLSYLIIDHIPAVELYSFLNCCDLFIAPSLLEGFGRTPVEAQGFGKLCLASDIPVFREVLGESAVLVPQPKEVSSWSKAFKLYFEGSYTENKKLALDNYNKFTKENITDLFYKSLA